MTDYIFLLGRDPALSIIEIASYFQARKQPYHIGEYTEDYILISTNTLDAETTIQQLGGTTKIAIITQELEEPYQGTKNKITYSINNFTENKELYEDIKLQLITSLKEQGLKIIERKKLEKKPSKAANVDLEIVVAGEHVGIVQATAKTKDYQERDEKRPNFEAARVISIRLAKILINLSQAKPGTTLLDPYCGLGTILQEALLQKINVIGTDNDKIMIKKTQENLQWLGKTTNYQLINADATKLGNLNIQTDQAATEPYLGPYIKTVMNKEEALQLAQELEQLYTKTLQQLHKIVQGKIAFIFPRFKTKQNERVTLRIDKILADSGYKSYQPYKGIAMPIPYYHKRSAIERFIYVLEKN
ncbi:MAG: hypothetical protein Q7R56_02945 [Nanoarchaeota archaeon]|nr:hypothetical protein [Nanoarchaeota archaeon]